jgi:hypothetical protein
MVACSNGACCRSSATAARLYAAVGSTSANASAAAAAAAAVTADTLVHTIAAVSLAHRLS